jgi:hypothetical protein
MHSVIGRCPICQDELIVTRLQCGTCGTTIEGSFSLGPLQRLNQEQIQFVEALVRCRGSLKDVGAELNMSYPTVNSRLNDILLAMGYGERVKAATTESPETPSLSREQRREILSQLREGKLSAAEAERLLRGKT